MLFVSCYLLLAIWSNFMRMHIDKKLCHFFMVNLSSLLTLIFIEIAWGLFLLLKFKLLVDNWIKNRHIGCIWGVHCAPKIGCFFQIAEIQHSCGFNYSVHKLARYRAGVAKLVLGCACEDCLFYFILFYCILSFFILFYFILFHFILSHIILFHFCLFYFILFHFILLYLIFLILLNFILSYLILF